MVGERERGTCSKWLYVLLFVITSGGHYFVMSLQIPPKDPTTSPRSREAEIIAIAFLPSIQVDDSRP